MPEDPEYFVRYNELRDAPPHRLFLGFKDSYAIVLLNEEGLQLVPHLLALKGKRVELIKENPQFGGPIVKLAMADPAIQLANVEHPRSIKSWHVHIDGSNLLIPLHTAPIGSEAASAAVANANAGNSEALPPIIGIVITGKTNLSAGGELTDVHMLAKDIPTPFIADDYGDSYNDNYDLEPRIVETVPSTVYACVNGIMDAAKRALQMGHHEVAALKYRKAFHYCHKYFPETLEDAELEIAADLKMRSLLNLAVVALKIGNHEWARNAIEACDFVLGMPECKEVNRAKAFYRRGRARLQLGDDKLALSDLEDSLALVDDPQTRAAFAECRRAAKKRGEKLKERLRNAFA